MVGGGVSGNQKTPLDTPLIVYVSVHSYIQASSAREHGFHKIKNIIIIFFMQDTCMSKDWLYMIMITYEYLIQVPTWLTSWGKNLFHIEVKVLLSPHS